MRWDLRKKYIQLNKKGYKTWEGVLKSILKRTD